MARHGCIREVVCSIRPCHDVCMSMNNHVRRIALHMRHPYGMFRCHWTNVADRWAKATGVRGTISRTMTRIEPEDWRNYFS